MRETVDVGRQPFFPQGPIPVSSRGRADVGPLRIFLREPIPARDGRARDAGDAGPYEGRGAGRKE